MRKQIRIPWLAAAGVLLIIAGLAGLFSGPEISQYAFLRGDSKPEEILKQAEEKWTDIFPSLSLHGAAEKISLSAGERSLGEITLYETMGSFFEIHPREFSLGRPLSRGDQGHSVIVLDEDLAFQLYGDRNPLGQKAVLGEKSFEVVGVAAHCRRIGETGARTAWIPLGAQGAPETAVLVLSAGGPAADAERTLFETGAREICGNGQAFFLGKERIRGTILLQAVLIILGCALMRRWLRTFAGRIRTWIREIREQLRIRYPRQMSGLLAGRGLEMLLLTAATLAAGAGLAVWAVQPMMIFPEWVPDSLVDPEALIRRFRELTAAAAVPVQFRTPEMAEIRFWSGMIRWGTVLSLLGGFLYRSSRFRGKRGIESIS